MGAGPDTQTPISRSPSPSPKPPESTGHSLIEATSTLKYVVLAYDVLGSGRATAGDEMFRQLVLARIIEPASKLDSLRVLKEAGEAPASYPSWLTIQGSQLTRRCDLGFRSSWKLDLRTNSEL
jgi:hypothetical protein